MADGVNEVDNGSDGEDAEVTLGKPEATAFGSIEGLTEESE